MSTLHPGPLGATPPGPPPAPAPLPARFHALVPCAGTGSRAGAAGPKQYVDLAGRPLVAWTLQALAAVPSLAGTLVVLSPDDAQFAQVLPAPPSGVRVAHVGGDTRAASVRAGLEALRAQGAAGHDWVLVHDAARCLLQPEAVERLIAACRDDAVGGLLALPVADTLKAADADGRVAATVDRSAKWAAQTPQMFRLDDLAAALDAATAAGLAITDEASALEAQGQAPRLVRGSAENFKVTWPEDFALAARLLATR